MTTSSDPPAGTVDSELISRDELQLATRNHGMPLEALRYPVTPVGLHYLLIHYDIPAVDSTAWRLQVDGAVSTALELSMDDLRSRPRVSLPVTFECAGNGRALLRPRAISQPWLHEAVGTAEWTGTPLRGVLADAGVADGAVEVLFTGLDRGVEGGVEQNYERSLPLAEAVREEVLLVYEANGDPLPPQHGFPLRLVVPGWYGMTNVKWLSRISVLDQPFSGYQQATAYRLYEVPDVPGEHLTRMAPRALMIPPGVPDFMTRRRFVDNEACALRGRAWSGRGPVARVEVSADHGRSWQDATLDEPVSAWAWRGWTCTWDPPGPGDYELWCRATDAAGNSQPTDDPWNLKGYANNAAQRVVVTVRA